MSDPISHAAGVSAASGVAQSLGLKLEGAQLEVLGEAIVGLVQVIGKDALKRAAAAGEAAAAAITTADEAEQAAQERR